MSSCLRRSPICSTRGITVFKSSLSLRRSLTASSPHSSSSENSRGPRSSFSCRSFWISATKGSTAVFFASLSLSSSRSFSRSGTDVGPVNSSSLYSRGSISSFLRRSAISSTMGVIFLRWSRSAVRSSTLVGPVTSSKEKSRGGISSPLRRAWISAHRGSHSCFRRHMSRRSSRSLTRSGMLWGPVSSSSWKSRGVVSSFLRKSWISSCTGSMPTR
mmetsp:Transcript_49226/g.96552  ORF Transcript_49226/g.96552 Transcript_49226/m.96552 type:complete len:216 (+) Transcript_49226:3664-4311(+)